MAGRWFMPMCEIKWHQSHCAHHYWNVKSLSQIRIQMKKQKDNFMISLCKFLVRNTITMNIWWVAMTPHCILPTEDSKNQYKIRKSLSQSLLLFWCSVIQPSFFSCAGRCVKLLWCVSLTTRSLPAVTDNTDLPLMKHIQMNNQDMLSSTVIYMEEFCEKQQILYEDL